MIDLQFYREDEIPTLGQCTGITPAFALDLAWPVKIPSQSPICANLSNLAQSGAGSRAEGGLGRASNRRTAASRAAGRSRPSLRQPAAAGLLKNKIHHGLKRQPECGFARKLRCARASRLPVAPASGFPQKASRRLRWAMQQSSSAGRLAGVGGDSPRLPGAPIWSRIDIVCGHCARY